MTNSSIEIGRSNLLILKNVYKLNRFKSEIGYLTLNNYVQWLEQDQHVKHVRIYCLNGDFSDGTFVLTVSFGFSYHPRYNCYLAGI